MQPFDFTEEKDFIKNWAALRLTDDDLQTLQKRLMADPLEGDVIPGTGGLRKLRIKLAGRGKRGGGRVIYVIIQTEQLIVLHNVYAKNE